MEHSYFFAMFKMELELGLSRTRFGVGEAGAAEVMHVVIVVEVVGISERAGGVGVRVCNKGTCSING